MGRFPLLCRLPGRRSRLLLNAMGALLSPSALPAFCGGVMPIREWSRTASASTFVMAGIARLKQKLFWGERAGAFVNHVNKIDV